jgi:small subunit ribosomal protein S8e
MTQYQGRKGNLKREKKKKSDLGSDPRLTHLAHGKEEEETKNLRTKGGGEKTVAVRARFANVSVKGKVQRVAIKSVLDNPANKDFRRMDIITRGGVIETELGKARVTSRPSQDSVVNAVLIE